MKSFIAYVGVAALALFGGVHAKSARGQPGFCNSDKDCQKESKDYVCVSVQTTRSGVELVKQCVPFKTAGDVCAGKQPGLCPSFSTWSKEFKSISSVCAFIIPEAKCNKDSSKSTRGTVDCLDVQTDDGESEKVIYGCVDYDGNKLLFKDGSDSARIAQNMNYTKGIAKACVNPSGDRDIVCSGRGTCTTYGAGQIDFTCKCNVGYEGKFCNKITSNKCTTKAQCAAGVCDLIKQECVCSEGTKGDQCAECDAASSKACNGHGSCGGSNSTCTCEEGWAGAHCDRKMAGDLTTGEKIRDGGSASESSSAVSLSVSLVFGVSTMIVAALFN
jgi:hypothetical protein